jgi:DNA-binding GntR family transcriptional regulator
MGATLSFLGIVGVMDNIEAPSTTGHQRLQANSSGDGLTYRLDIADHGRKRLMTDQVAEAGDEFQQTQTLTERAYQELEEEIVTLRIPPGAMVSELQLSRRLEVGRTPIREALQRLAREGLVVIMPRRGIFVSDIDVGRQLRLLEVRRVLERLIIQSSAKRSTASQRAQFERIAAGMDRAAKKADDLAFMRLDREFNLLLLDACANEFAAATMGLMNGMSRRFWYIHYKQIADLPLAARLHAAIAREIAAGDAEKAAKASNALMDYIQAFARKTLE